jgi:hypothetical protein
VGGNKFVGKSGDEAAIDNPRMDLPVALNIKR